MGIGIGLIVAVAALNIIASLVLLVMEKTRDIAILKTMGASARSVMLIFLMQGIVIGVLGTVGRRARRAWWCRSCSIATASSAFRATSIRSRICRSGSLPLDLAFVIAGAVVVCFFATLYPSRQAARLDPAQALRYE